MSTDIVDPVPKETPQDAAQVLESIGMSDDTPEKAKERDHSDGHEAKEEGLPAYAKERLGRQEKRHRREMAEIRAQMQQMQMQAGQNSYPNAHENMPNPSGNPLGDPNTPAPQGVDDQIQRAVTYALKHKEMAEQQAKNAEKMAHVQDQYQALQEMLDKGSEKYDDFDEVVRGNKVPFTDAMRDAALLLPHNNADEVLYKLGKNTEELKRISQLHPIDQVRELMKLSVALKDGPGKAHSAEARPIGQIKNQPVTSSGITEKTSIRELREKMKAGWK